MLLKPCHTDCTGDALPGLLWHMSPWHPALSCSPPQPSPLQMRSDKVIVFSDNIFALRSYAVALNKPFIYGATSHAERTRVLHAFKHSATVSTPCA